MEPLVLSRGAIRLSRHASDKGGSRGSIVDAISIRERPAWVEDRSVPGHWEGDLLCGSSNSYIATLVERHSRYVLLVKVANRDSRSVITALIEQAKRLPDELCKLLTWDRQGDGGAQAVYAGDRFCGLLLRPAEPVAARL